MCVLCTCIYFSYSMAISCVALYKYYKYVNRFCVLPVWVCVYLLLLDYKSNRKWALTHREREKKVRKKTSRNKMTNKPETSKYDGDKKRPKNCRWQKKMCVFLVLLFLVCICSSPFKCKYQNIMISFAEQKWMSTHVGRQIYLREELYANKT